MKADAVAPVRKSLRVKLAPAQAFELFTRDLARWWPLATRSCSGDPKASVVFEGVGGRVVETAGDGTRHVWGALLDWNPPHSFAMTWHPAQPEDQATRVEVRFVAASDGTEVQLEHSGWEARGDRAAAVRESYDGGWTRVLAQYLACAEEEK